jgi:hypothetical protein
MAQPLIIATITIDANDVLSTILDASGCEIVRIMMPDEWTPANLSFRVSQTAASGDFRDLYSSRGNEVLIPCVARACFGLGQEGRGITQSSFLRFRSGPSGGPIQQAALRLFTVVMSRSVAALADAELPT